MKHRLLFVIICISFCSFTFGQIDSITIYTNSKGEKETKDKAIYYEVLTKSSDSLWLVKKYLNGMDRLIRTSYYKTKDKKIKVGKELKYNKHGVLVGEREYDDKGIKIGRNITWFNKEKINFEGFYVNGKQEGEWDFFHFNGNLALKKVYKEGELLYKVYYNEKGKELPKTAVIVNKEDRVFKGGKKRYFEKIKAFGKKINFKMKGTITVRYLIGIDGKISDVTTDEPLPDNFKEIIIDFFENLKGWKPRIHYNRKIPSVYIQRMRF